MANLCLFLDIFQWLIIGSSRIFILFFHTKFFTLFFCWEIILIAAAATKNESFTFAIVMVPSIHESITFYSAIAIQRW